MKKKQLPSHNQEGKLAMETGPHSLLKAVSAGEKGGGYAEEEHKSGGRLRELAEEVGRWKEK